MTKATSSAPQLIADAARLLNEGSLPPARDAARRALALHKDNPAALNLLGVIEGKLGHHDVAAKHLRRLVELQPQSPDAHFNLGAVLHETNDWDGAERHYRQALLLKPNHAPYYNNLGSLYQLRKEIGPARQFYELAVKCDPHHENAVINLYGVYRTLGDMAALEKVTARSVKIWPENSIHYIARSESLFALGRISEAWDAYSWRFKASQRQASATARTVPGVPEWAGENLQGKTLLIWTEQGVGDEVLYSTYLSEIRAKVARLILLCSKRMAPLFERTFPDVEVFGAAVPQAILEQVDYQASIIAFAKILRPTLSSFATVPYRLRASPEKKEKFRAKYSRGTNDLLVGISWRSSRVQYADSKTVGLGEWGALFSVPGVTFVDLQYGDTSVELQQIKAAYGVSVVHDASVDSLLNLDVYAAQVSAMDVVVSSSNTAAHFGGATQVPTVCMIPATVGFGRRWYWFEKDGASAWYPSMKLISQRKPGTWVDVIRDATLAVARMSFERGHQKEVAAFLFRLAKTYASAADRESAVVVLEMMTALPGYELQAFFELARGAKEVDRNDLAEQYFERALLHDPNSAPALNMKGMLLAARENYADAESHYRRAIASAPLTYEPYNNLATLLRRVGRSAEATDLYIKAHAMLPDHKGILLNLASTLNENGWPEQALPYFQRLIQLEPNYAEAHHGYAFALLSSGQFLDGWRELQWRHKVLQNIQRPPDNVPPVWNGHALASARLLVWTEQGLGDEILAMTMLPDAVHVAAAVTLLCSIRMVPVFKRAFPTVSVQPYTALSGLDLTSFDFQMSVAELGQAFRPSIAAFANREPYLRSANVLRSSLSAKYRSDPGARLIGVSWASAHRELASLKGIELQRIVEGIMPTDKDVVISLQYGDHVPEIESVKQATGENCRHRSGRGCDPGFRQLYSSGCRNGCCRDCQ